jgi:hypothetical protein
VLVLFACAVLWPVQLHAQITAVVRPGGVILELVGKTKTASCVIPPDVLQQFR